MVPHPFWRNRFQQSYSAPYQFAQANPGTNNNSGVFFPLFKPLPMKPYIICNIVGEDNPFL